VIGRQTTDNAVEKCVGIGGIVCAAKTTTPNNYNNILNCQASCSRLSTVYTERGASIMHIKTHT